MERSKLYFVSDFHLGIPDHDASLEREKLLVQWLDDIKNDVAEIFLMGDIFDFWFEYKTVVPKGYVRLLGKLAELTDSGIPIHVFRGNHDLWAFDYLEKEVGVHLYRKPVIREIFGKVFFLAHGDGLGPGDRFYKVLKHVFEFRLNQILFSWLHPDWGAAMGNYFSRRSRLAKMNFSLTEAQRFEKDKEILYQFARQKASEHPEVDYFVFGHRHIPLQMELNDKANLVVLGDWLSHFTYGVFEDGNMQVKSYKV